MRGRRGQGKLSEEVDYNYVNYSTVRQGEVAPSRELGMFLKGPSVLAKEVIMQFTIFN